jgi:NADPH:quinone reductase-like Zn-dependent oxidoreductase
MQAIQYAAYGGPASLQLVSMPDPEPAADELRVRLLAAGLAPVDTKLRAGMLQAYFKLALPKVPGRDGVGVVDRVGSAVVGFAVGDPVCVVADQLGSGTHAQYVVCGTSRVVARAPGLSTHQAAALMQPGISAWTAVMETAQVHGGLRVLVHGGAGAVGSLMVQLCRHLGAEVTATCRAGNRDHVLALGATRAIAYDGEDFGALRDQDVVFDLIGGDTHARSYPVLRKGGHLVYLTAAPIIDRGAEFGVRVTRAAITDRPGVLAAVAQLAAQGIFRPAVARVYPLAQAALAHAALESGQVTRGRVVLDIAALPGSD